MPQPIRQSLKFAPRRDTQAPVVVERTLAFFGDKHIAGGGIKDDPGDDLTFAGKPNRDRENRQTVKKIGGPVERIDEPGVAFVGAFDTAAFLHHKTIARTRPRQFLVKDFFGLAVGGGDKISGPLTETCRFSTSPKSRVKPRPP